MTVSQAVLAFLFFTPFLPKGSALYANPNTIGTAYYLSAKKDTNFPQAVWAFCLSWVYWWARWRLRLPSFTIAITSARFVVRFIAAPLVLLTIVCTFGTVTYDIVYAISTTNRTYTSISGVQQSRSSSEHVLRSWSCSWSRQAALEGLLRILF